MPAEDLQDDEVAALNLVLGQTHQLLGDDGDEHAQRLVQAATLRLQRDGGYFHPMPGDNWTSPTYEAVLCVDPNMVPEFTEEITARIWSKLEAVLRGRGRSDAFTLTVAAEVPPLPDVAEDWRAAAAPRRDRAIRRGGSGRRLDTPSVTGWSWPAGPKL